MREDNRSREMEETAVLRYTYSVCPICLRRIEARHVRRKGGVFLEKECPEHGAFSVPFWRDRIDLADWIKDAEPIRKGENLNCPHACGLCPDHRRDTCCVVLEVTGRCNLDCSFCFADKDGLSEPSFDRLRESLRQLIRPGATLVQLSGGEPTLRDDLPELVAEAKKAGCKYVQLNSNGIRLAEDRKFVKALADAGLSFVFMQFDGIRDGTYEKLRRRPLLGIKRQAIVNCGECGLGVVLVPTLVPGVNIDEIGDIIRFGVALSPFVRGVHFQPVSYFGRIPRLPEDEDRFTLDELIWQIGEQAGDLVRPENLGPSCCDHPLCGFHGDFIVLGPGKLLPLSKRDGHTVQVFPGADPAARSREFVARRWQRGEEKLSGNPLNSRQKDIQDMDSFLERLKVHGFTVTAMPFQDAGNLDLERLRSCSLHVFEEEKMIPLCVRYLTAWRGK